MKTKEPKSLTVNSKPDKVVTRIKELEAALKKPKNNNPLDIRERNEIKSALRILYAIRKKQKNYTLPPRRLTSKRF